MYLKSVKFKGYPHQEQVINCSTISFSTGSDKVHWRPCYFKYLPVLTFLNELCLCNIVVGILCLLEHLR